MLTSILAIADIDFAKGANVSHYVWEPRIDNQRSKAGSSLCDTPNFTCGVARYDY